MRRPRLDSTTGASILVYVVLLAFALFEQVGRTTNDTKTPLIERPGAFLHEATTLWDPMTNFGELQNQAYGYLFPQGPFFLLTHLAHVAPWVSERLWSVLVVVIAAEGLRQLARAIGLGPWAAWVAGMSYGLAPRMLSQVAVRSAEVLPTAVLPWVVLPVVLAITGRLSPRRAALFSGVAFLFSGAVNATATVAGLPVVVILIVWAARRRLVPWSMLGWWSLVIAVTNFWWASALIRLRIYSPQFFDYVEDAKTTTEATGYAATLRGLSNWINYAYLGNRPNWPAGFEYAYQPAMVLASGLVAAIGVIGLVFLPKPWRAPLVVAASVGVVCVTVGHTSPSQSPLAGPVQHLLDGNFALLRNVSKAELMLRLPMCLGIGAVFGHLVTARTRPRLRRHWAPLGVVMGLLVALVLGMAQPAVATKLRTPGWIKVPDYWSQAADYLHKAPGTQRAWVVPGTGFGLQTWGWTMDEPFQSVARSPWVSRSQVPLTPPTTIRTLSSLEHFLETGSGSPDLGPALGRLGIGYVLVRHDLDEQAADTTTSNLVSIALARSRGVKRVALFGQLDFGPAIEVYRVTSDDVAPDLQVRPLSDAVTVDGASSDVIGSVTEGLITPQQPALVQGDDGWDPPADIVGDSYRDRERNFGRVHDGEGPVRSAGEPYYGHRIVPDYPANQGSRPVRATYDQGAFATASSSQAWTNGLGQVEPQSAPYAAFDGDERTGWSSAFGQPAARQWLEVRWPSPHEIGKVQIRAPVDDGQAVVRTWRVSAGGRSAIAYADPFTGLATADLTGVTGSRLRIAVDRVAGGSSGAVSILEVSSDMTPYQRSLLIPEGAVADEPSFVFTAQPETRACISTLLGPDCNQGRQAASEESGGIDRTFRVPKAGAWALSGTVLARSTPGTVSLLNPLSGGVLVRSSSQWLSDPAVSARLAYDGATTTSWIADPRDASPTLTVDFDRPRRIDRLTVAPPAPPAVTPTTAVIRSAEGTRSVQLGEFGQFPSLRTRHLTITFANPTRGAAPIGISELYLPPTEVARPLAGGDITGAVCGLGPVLFVDGRRYETAVRGFIGDVVSAGPLHYESCSGPVKLDAGTHTFRLGSTEQFQPVSAVLRGPAKVPAGTRRTLSPPSGPVTHQTVRVGPGTESLLSTTRNVNAGWKATLNGRSLRPMMSDGWAQAWRIPAGKGGSVVITYAPQRSYLLALFLGLAVAGLVLAGALVLLLGTRLRAPGTLPAWPPPTPTKARWLGGFVLALLAAWVLGGAPALAAVAVGGPLVLLGRRELLRWVAFGCVVAAYAVSAWVLRDGARLRINTADVLAGFGFVLMLTSLAPSLRRRVAPTRR
jgi:arabinofuranan 3-O-arabinosyltransferase